MKSISAVIIDTYQHKKMAEIAINMILRLPFITADDGKAD